MASHDMRIESIFVTTLLATHITNKGICMTMAPYMDIIQHLVLKRYATVVAAIAVWQTWPCFTAWWPLVLWQLPSVGEKFTLYSLVRYRNERVVAGLCLNVWKIALNSSVLNFYFDCSIDTVWPFLSLGWIWWLSWICSHGSRCLITVYRHMFFLMLKVKWS